MATTKSDRAKIEAEADAVYEVDRRTSLARVALRVVEDEDGEWEIEATEVANSHSNWALDARRPLANRSWPTREAALAAIPEAVAKAGVGDRSWAKVR